MDDGRDEDLRTIVRDFRTSVSDDLTAAHRQMSELADEVRTRLTTTETAILNAVGDLGRDLDRRLLQVERRLADAEARFQGIETAR